MFWISLFLIIGGSYLYYRFHIISNKTLFYQSPLFRSITGSIGVLALSLLIVNFIAPREIQDQPLVVTDTLSTEEQNTELGHLLKKDQAFHYMLISKLSENYQYIDQLATLQKRYRQFLKSSDPHIVSLGNYYLGIVALKNNDTDGAAKRFSRVSDRQIPYFHFCLGELYMEQNKLREAEEQYRLELILPGGYTTGAFLKLMEFYETAENYTGLRDLMEREPADSFFPEDLARITLLNTGDVAYYMMWVYKSIVNRTNLPGFIAALAISLIWLIYIFRLDVFKRGRFTSLLLMFLAGMLSVFMMISFNDVHDMMIDWSMNGQFFHDLIYCVVMIGIPEEFVKIFPLLVLLMLAGALKEPIDYIVYASASALGFAFIENLLYFQEITNGIIHGRAYFAVIGHMVDSSFVAYGFVLSRFSRGRKASPWYIIPLSYFAACLVHGIYDFLIFHEHNYLFFIFFIFVIQCWIIVINNCMNNSSRFSYKVAPLVERSKVYVALALSVIFGLEYIFSGFLTGSEQANEQLYGNVTFAGFLIIFFSSNLSSFDLVKGYWRDIYFSSREKRGYGTRQAQSLLVSWYFVNSIRAHNYVGLKICLCNDPYNKALAEILNGKYEGRIVNRVILYEKDVADPHWFIIKLDTALPIEGSSQEYVLIKLRYQEDSLLYEDEVQVFFKGIGDLNKLRTPKPEKELFPFYGWAYISLSINNKQNISSHLFQRKPAIAG